MSLDRKRHFVEALKAHYRELKKTAPDRYEFGVVALYNLGYYLLGRERIEDAIAVFALNVEAHPEHSGAHGALGEAYMRGGDRKAAIRHLQKAVDLMPDNTRRRAMLDALLAEEKKTDN